MTREKWQAFLAKIDNQFDIIEQDKEELDPETGGGILEYVIFVGPLGEMRAEFTEKPKVVGRKVVQSKRIGSDAHETLEYDKNERVGRLRVFVWDDTADDWKEIDADAFL